MSTLRPALNSTATADGPMAVKRATMELRKDGAIHIRVLGNPLSKVIKR